MMKRILLIALLCGVSAFFGTLGVMYGTAEKEPVVYYSQVTDLTWQAYIVEPEPIIAETNVDELFIVTTDEVLDYRELDKFCLAKNIYHEARSEDLLGRMAVAQVTLNRVDSPKYPNTVCEVVMQRKQFSWANDKSIRWSHPKGRAWQKAKDLAEDFLANGVRVQGLQTALFYHADYVSPNWRNDEFQVATVGRHIFYEKAKPL